MCFKSLFNCWLHVRLCLILRSRVFAGSRWAYSLYPFHRLYTQLLLLSLCCSSPVQRELISQSGLSSMGVETRVTLSAVPLSLLPSFSFPLRRLRLSLQRRPSVASSSYVFLFGACSFVVFPWFRLFHGFPRFPGFPVLQEFRNSSPG